MISICQLFSLIFFASHERKRDQKILKHVKTLKMVIKRCKYKGLHILKKGLSWLRPQEKSSFWSPEDVIKARSLESGQPHLS